MFTIQYEIEKVSFKQNIYLKVKLIHFFNNYDYLRYVSTQILIHARIKF